MIKIMVEGEGLKDVELVTIEEGGTARRLVELVAAKGGYGAEEAILLVEDGDELIELDVVLAEDAQHKIHHVHRAQHVEVVVFYQGGSNSKKFRPSARVQRVLDWAVGPEAFDVDKAIAPEMELARQGQTAELPKNAHLGRFVRHAEPRLELDLLRGIIPNG